MKENFMKLFWTANLCLAVIGVIVQSAPVKVGKVYVEYGQNLGATVPARLNYLFGKAGVAVETYSPDVESTLDAGSLVLTFGNSTKSNKFVSLEDVKLEGFKIASQTITNGATLISSNGRPLDPRGKSFAIDRDAVHYGAVVGAYAVLEQLGFSFLHPMEPIIPKLLNLPTGDISTSESPYWPTRTWHIHTQHPLEFTEVLNGFDAPMFAHYDEQGLPTKDASEMAFSSKHKCQPHQYCESWESMFSTLDGLFEWLMANRQNRVEVLLLGSPKWDMYGNLTSGPERQARLKRINTLAHSYGVLMGADIPIANAQQHGWKMISLKDTFEQQTLDIQNRVDWAFAAEYDFISTESGLSEFTKPSCDLMLSLFNIFTERSKIFFFFFVPFLSFFVYLFCDFDACC